MSNSLTQGLHRSIQQRPKTIATIFGDRRQTFETLGHRVAKLAGALRSVGVGAGDRVGMMALNSDRYYEYYLGTWWAGAVVNPCNVRWSAAELAYSLDDCDTRTLIVDDTFLPMAEQLKSRSRSLETIIHMGQGGSRSGFENYEALVDAADPLPDHACAGDDLAGVFYTGGTTGAPKGVMLTHGSIFSSSMALAAEINMAADSICLHTSPMFHIADAGTSVSQTMVGATHCFVSSFNPEEVLRLVEKERVTHAQWVPVMIQMLVDCPYVSEANTEKIESVLYGASPISEAVLTRALEAFPNARFTQVYGMTELSPVATILPADRHVSVNGRATKLRSAGRASLCSEVRVVDPEGREVAPGTVGEIAVRGPNVMRGYWNKPEATASVIRDGWMMTGDAAYMDDEGYFFIVDRLKDMIVSGGENVYSGEVENALMQMPAIASCAVIPVPHPKWGEAVHAVVVLKPGHEATQEAVIEHCQGLIARYKCPRSVEFRDALPLSGAGKILKTPLREAHWAGHERKVN